MTPELEALARRAVACKGWRWMAGMLATYAGVSGEEGALARLVWPKGGSEGDWCFGRWYMFPDAAGTRVVLPALPDLTDPATLGCLLALVREAWGDALLHCAPSSHWHRGEETWIVWRFTGKPLGWMHECRATTEAACLVFALEAAP